MRRVIKAAIVALSLTWSFTAMAQSGGRHIVLPNPKLLGCSGAGCAELWQDTTKDENAVYPWQVSTDVNNQAVIGIVALYDKPVSFDEVKSAIDERYGKWTLLDTEKPRLKMWRVESEKFTIQLAPKKNGMIQLIYLVFDAKHDLRADNLCDSD